MKDFNNILKDKIQDYREEPPIELFDKIRENYPRRTFSDILKNNKGYVISCALVLVSILGIIIYFNIPSHNINNPEESVLQTVDREIRNTDKILQTNKTESFNDVIIKDINIELNSSGPVLSANKPGNPEFFNAEIFKIGDTVVCGNMLDINPFININNVVLPDNVTVISNNDALKLVSSKPGKYLIKYYEEKSNKAFVDSMFVQFNQVEVPEISLSSDILCCNEDLFVTIEGNDYKSIKWDVDDATVKSITRNKYKITGLNAGIHNIALTFTVDQCLLTQEKKVTVKEDFKYAVNIKPNYCAGLNASINIEALNYAPEYYILDDNLVNKTGIFNNLNSGIHILKTNYGGNCYSFDTLFVFDSLNLNPYFRSEKDLTERNKYYFRNYTKIDDRGFEQNNNIEFIWKINGQEFSRTDNPNYEFRQSGKFIVELTAVLSNDCFSTYSENIIISDLELKIPNVFTPNGDGIGDYFEVYYEEEFLHYNIIITSTQGEKVFESDDIGKSWDGKIFGNNDAPDGYYYYIISGESKDGIKVDQNGIVQLIRR